MSYRGAPIRLRGSVAVTERPSVQAALPFTCVHRWRIPEPNGATGTGICGKCGAEKQFKNGCDYFGNFEDGFVL